MMPFPSVFKVFNSHSRDVSGRPSAVGYSVLLSIEGIESLGGIFDCNCVIQCNDKPVKAVCYSPEKRNELQAVAASKSS